jgi:hypothetical protein
MFRRVLLLLLVLPLMLACWGGGARADESGCKATVVLVNGEKAKVANFGVRLLEDAFIGTQMMVKYEGGQAIINIRKLARLTRVAPAGEVPKGRMVTFAFQTTGGSKGKLRIDSGYIFAGRLPLGDWKVFAGQVKEVKLRCPQDDLTPPRLDD